MWAHAWFANVQGCWLFQDWSRNRLQKSHFFYQMLLNLYVWSVEEKWYRLGFHGDASGPGSAAFINRTRQVYPQGWSGQLTGETKSPVPYLNPDPTEQWKEALRSYRQPSQRRRAKHRLIFVKPASLKQLRFWNLSDRVIRWLLNWTGGGKAKERSWIPPERGETFVPTNVRKSEFWRLLETCLSSTPVSLAEETSFTLILLCFHQSWS